MATRLTGVVIQASDVKSLSEFWSAALGEPATAAAHCVALEFVPADGPKPAGVKNRVHLDLQGGPEQLERLLALGAVRADIGQGEVPWVVLADPEGNEFCLQPRPDPGIRWSAICQDAADTQVQSAFWTVASGWQQVDEGSWGVALKAQAAENSADQDSPRLVMGPPQAPKDGPARIYLRLAPQPHTDAAVEASRLVHEGAKRSGELLIDPEGNEFWVA
jgi:hypothetical protein